MTQGNDDLDRDLPDLKEYQRAKAEQEAKRLKYDFTFPDSARVSEKDPHKVTLKMLSSGEEEMAEKTAGQEAGTSKRMAEKVKLALVSVDDRLVKHVDMDDTLLWDGFSAKIRRLLFLAFNKIHGTTDQEDEDFLKTLVIRV